MGNEEYNEYAEGEEIDYNIDENDGIEEEIIENDKENEEDNGE